MAAKKTLKKKMPLVMRADDTMPWGEYSGVSIRTIYYSDQEYFQYLLEREEYSIPEKTLEILEKGIDIVDRSEPTFTRGAKLNKTEYKEKDVVCKKNGQAVTLP